MKRTLIVVVIAVVLLGGCDWVVAPDDVIAPAKIEFYNRMGYVSVDFEIYGIRLGEADHHQNVNVDTGSDYYDTIPGTYYVELRDSFGTWYQATTVAFTVEGGHTYRVEITGFGDTIVAFWLFRIDGVVPTN